LHYLKQQKRAGTGVDAGNPPVQAVRAAPPHARGPLGGPPAGAAAGEGGSEGEGGSAAGRQGYAQSKGWRCLIYHLFPPQTRSSFVSRLYVFF